MRRVNAFGLRCLLDMLDMLDMLDAPSSPSAGLAAGLRRVLGALPGPAPVLG